jgi:hypothetical protein
MRLQNDAGVPAKKCFKLKSSSLKYLLLGVMIVARFDEKDGTA